MVIVVSEKANSDIFASLLSNLSNSYKKRVGPSSKCYRGWSGGAMVLGKLPVLGRPTIWMIVGQEPIALAVVAGGGCLEFLLSSVLSLLFLPLSGRRPDID